jgi:hypothetical protein
MKRLPLLAMVLIAGPALAVGLGPLKKEGVTDGAAKGFWLTVSNAERSPQTFILTARGEKDEIEPQRVVVIPDRMMVAPERTRRVLVIAQFLAPSERYTFRVCAEAPPVPKETIHARVCSKLTARRIAAPF